MLAAWRFERRGRALDFGRPPEHDLREIMDAILYVDRTGVQWRYLPHDFPPWETVYGYFAKWAKEGVFDQLNGLLRELLRQKEGRNAEPSACVIDAQSVKTSTSAPASSQGTDAGKKIVGRKRSIVIDTIGLLLAVLVTAASVQDSVAGTRLLDQVAADHPGIRKAWVDGGYRQHLVEHAATLGIDMEITARAPGARGFAPIPKRWAVEICQAQCTHGVCCPVVSAVSVQMRRLYQPGGRVRRSRSSASSRWSAWAMSRWGQQLSRRVVIQPRLIQA